MRNFIVICLVASFCGVLLANDNKDDDGKKASIPAPLPGMNAVALGVFPETIDLNNARDVQSLVAQVTLANGLTQDVSQNLTVKIADEGIAKIVGDKLVPVADGETVAKIAYEGFVAELPVKVTGAAVEPTISFKNDVMPVFSKTGCNAGSCHGAARGKDGFRLSLYGFDPDGDHHRLTREMLGRRVDLAIPEDCLLINKSTGTVSHTGGELFPRDSEYYDTMMRWLKAGAPKDSGPVPTVTSIEIFPKGGVLNGNDETQKLTVRAKYSDGSDRDVTSLAYFMTSNENSALVTQQGNVTAKNRGEAFVMARFDTHTEGVHFLVLPKNQPFEWKNVPEDHFVDKLINDKLRKLRIQPSELCDDAEFIRRASLDICGIVPTVQQVNNFVASKEPGKRAKYVDELLNRKEFVEMWVMKWSELLQIRSTQQVSYKATLLYYNWLREQISSNVPVDEMFRNLLGSEGGTFTNAATNYYQNEQDTLKITENVAQVFLGMRIQCAQCHNHPFDRWTMDDYYGFAAFFTQIGRKRGDDPRETVVFNRNSGDMKHPVGGRVMAPKFLGGDAPETKNKDRRKVMADWMTAKDNPFFAKNLANIVWAHFMGRGIVQEVDDVRVSNPPVNPELLDELAKRVVEYNYDFKKLVRDICTSRTYQLSTQTNATNESDTRNFSHANLRRIRAEVLLDVISEITETRNKFRGLPEGARAVQIADGNTSTYFLTTFGRAKRESVCSCEVKMEPNLSQALHLINGSSVHAKVLQGKVIRRLSGEGQTVDQILDEIYLRCLARRPTDAERTNIKAEIDAAVNALKGEDPASVPDPAKAKETTIALLEDIFWAVLNSREFVFNH
jgi:hypothetical protein